MEKSLNIPPQCPVFNVLLPCTNFHHILLHYIQKFSLWPPSFQLFSCNSIYIALPFLVSPHDMSIPPQSALPHLHF